MFYALIQYEDYYEERINLFVALAPVTRLKDVENKIIDSSSMFHKKIDDFISNKCGVYEIFGP
jgi:hypothetical protein